MAAWRTSTAKVLTSVGTMHDARESAKSAARAKAGRPQHRKAQIKQRPFKLTSGASDAWNPRIEMFLQDRTNPPERCGACRNRCVFALWSPAQGECDTLTLSTHSAVACAGVSWRASYYLLHRPKVWRRASSLQPGSSRWVRCQCARRSGLPCKQRRSRKQMPLRKLPVSLRYRLEMKMHWAQTPST